MAKSILTIEIRYEQDVVLARQRARQVAALLHFENRDQARISTAVSEIARNAFMYARGGTVEFLLEENIPQSLLIRIRDRGPGIANLQAVLQGEGGMPAGNGLVAARKLMDHFQVKSAPGAGTTVELGRTLPREAPPVSPKEAERIAAELAQAAPENPLQEIQRQNQELIRALDEVRAQKEELARLNRELADTNRAVGVLYAELDEKAGHLRRSSELKSHFISNMSHEFRTPLNSIMTLAQLMLDGVDGKLAPEHEKQAGFIRKAAQSLSELVNDLLDLAKIEAGKTSIHPTDFRVEELFSTLRGLMRPLAAHNQNVKLVFDPVDGCPVLHSDEGKVSQILRNFISNALKFTARGEVRVAAAPGPDQTITFTVTDTGLGIAPQDQARIFEEYAQVEGPHQQGIKGTGLGLPLSKRLAQLLGGFVALQSAPGRGSTFSLTIPCTYRGPAEVVALPEISREVDPRRTPVLVVEDSYETIFVYEKFLKGSPFQVLPARNLDEARQMLRRTRPAAIVLDIMVSSEYVWSFLAELKASEETRDIPVLVVTIVDNEPKALALGAADFCIKPVERKWLLDHLKVLPRQEGGKILIVDDDEIARYLLKGFLAGTAYKVIEASDGEEGLRRAREEQPMAIFLDLVMPELDGFATLERLKADPATREIPVIVHSSKVLTETDYARLGNKPVAILSKQIASRDEALSNILEALANSGISPSKK